MMVRAAALKPYLKEEAERHPAPGPGRAGGGGGGYKGLAFRCEAAGFGTHGPWDAWIRDIVNDNVEMVHEERVDQLFQALDWTHLWQADDALAPFKDPRVANMRERGRMGGIAKAARAA